MSKCDLLGASAGALAIVLVACDVDFRHATRVAYRLAEENNLYERRLALVGIWGRLVREWLEELLPDDAHEKCNERTRICVLEVFPPPFNRSAVSRFESKGDLIECLMASVHIPFLLDYKPCSSFRGKLCIDGKTRLFFFFFFFFSSRSLSFHSETTDDTFRRGDQFNSNTVLLSSFPLSSQTGSALKNNYVANPEEGWDLPNTGQCQCAATRATQLSFT